MMRLTRKLRFAIEAVLDIAYNASDVPVQSKEIAERQGIPRRYLEQVLQHLVRADILRGVRGPRGGYRLARERRRIALAEIVRIVSEIEQHDAAGEDAGSPLGQAVLEPIWSELQAAAMVQLEKISIEDLCRKARDSGVESGREKKVDFAI